MALYKFNGEAAAETAAPVQNFYGVSGAVDSETGGAQAESFWGGDGDLMVGAGGDDTYYIKSATDRVVEQAGGGTDLIHAWRNINLADYANVENLAVDSDGVYGAGDGHDNVIYAGSGTEQLYGGGGQDVLVAGSGKDTFIVKAGEGSDAIYGFKTATDVVRLSAGFTSFADVQAHMTQVGADTKIDFGGGEGLILRGVQASALTGANFQLELAPARLGAMTFHDEFSGPLSLYDKESNPGGTWRPDYDLQGTQGAGSYTLSSNGERQIYTSPYFRDHNGDFAESPFVSNGDGTLSIIARPSSNPEIFGYGYTSGMISSKESFAQTYGYFEMRAELPHAAGGWPAFWLLPADRSWPPELDVMETLTNDPHADWTTAHSGVGGTHTSSGIASYIPDTADGFHTYGVLWTSSDLVWYVDNVEVFHAATPADMNKPMYMIANLALGGWGGSIDNAAMPAEMKIDYIRAYSLGSTATASPPPVVSPPPPTGSGQATSPLQPTSGSDVLQASAGQAEIHGGAGADTLTGWSGNSFLTGDDGDDLINGGSGFDRTNGNAGNDTVHGNGGDDWVTGGRDNDLLFGDDGRDILNGNLGNDTMDGGAGDDVVRGGQGDDLLKGGDGADWLTGDRGSDTLTGGAGADTFQLFSGSGADRVTDFNAAEGDHVALDVGVHYQASQVGADTMVTLDTGDSLTLAGVSLSSLPPGWIFQA
ncbi:family 16 glycosylhydrolase [Phenylobacterium soli]|uniref:1,3-beta-glucanase n=1 Tax=Phenylobacterium soli TaxID=2170551 RepID=A0A328AP00_9CAUL|nr:family 16 glycosylhydrolase [Phenylobacterium soli]RAK55586.1 1,3-beta-glucanase [Phenylobacterium soli]